MGQPVILVTLMSGPEVSPSGNGAGVTPEALEVAEVYGQGTRLLMTIVVLVVLYLLSRWLRSWMEEPPPNQSTSALASRATFGNGSTRHHWHFSDLIIQPIHCNICHTLLLTTKGQYCSNCGIGSCLNPACVQKANSAHMCKEISCYQTGLVTSSPSHNQQQAVMTSSEQQQQVRRFRHHWISGNLPLNSECEVCEEVCGDGTGIVDLKCCWCHRTVHNKCQQQLSELCDLGEFKKLIVPPFCVKTNVQRSRLIPARMRSAIRITVRQIERPTQPPPSEAESPWMPLVVVGNRKSGNNDGAAILPAFRGQLNPAQVTDLDQSSMEEALKWLRLFVPEVEPVVVVAGGDGTIGWVLNSIDKMMDEQARDDQKKKKANGQDPSNTSFINHPALALVPLGTGNDLGRSLGYGPGLDASANVREIMQDILYRSKKVMLDRWKVAVKHEKHFGVQFAGIQEIYMQNYLSIGVDALVTFNFHKARESPFYLMSSRLINKLIYFSYGTKDVLERECKDLDKILELYLDGRRIDLPNIESVVVLNIPCWGAGVRPWELGTDHAHFPPPSMSDKKLEVFCIYSSFHIAQMQVGLSEPFRIGQAERVEIVLKGSAPMQTDGEPWEQHPAKIVISHHKQVPVLAKDENPSPLRRRD